MTWCMETEEKQDLRALKKSLEQMRKENEDLKKSLDAAWYEIRWLKLKN